MLIVIRSLLVLYGVIAIATGSHAVTGPYDPAVAPMADNSHRFVAAIWASTSLAFFYTAWNPGAVELFRFLMIALFLGGIVRAAALVHYPPSAVLIAVILLELVPTPLLYWMHGRLLASGSL